MSVKAILAFCAQALLVKCALSQCIGAPGLAAPYGLAYDGLAAPFGYDGLSGCAGRGLAYDGLAAPFGYDGLAGCAGRGLAYDGLAAPLAYDGFAGRGLAYDGLYPAIAPAMDYTPTSGGALPVSSASAIAPVGISVASENVYEGALAVAGELPFVGTAGLEGVLPTAGAGAVNHACGNGINAMISETTAFAPGYAGAAIAPAAAIAPYGAIAPSAAIAPGFGYRAGYAGRGCGCAF